MITSKLEDRHKLYTRRFIENAVLMLNGLVAHVKKEPIFGLDEHEAIEDVLMNLHRASIMAGEVCSRENCDWHNFVIEEQAGDLIEDACDSCRLGGDCGRCWKIYQNAL